MNTAIIVAAGSGKRFGGKTPKQFLEVQGKPLIIYALERFESCDSIGEIVLVLTENEVEPFSRLVSNYDLKKLKRITNGGKTRSESVYNGLMFVTRCPDTVVAVHDGARPLVTVQEISDTVAKAGETGAACLVCEVTDTIKKVSDGKILGTIDRSKLRRAVTPQCFRYDLLIKAFEQNEFGDALTDECTLLEKLGYEIGTVEGSAQNIKVTRPEDLVFVKSVLEHLGHV